MKIISKATLTLLFITLIQPNSFSKDNTNWLNDIERVSVEGTIIDLNTGESLVGVQVSFKGINKVVYTNFDGKFTVDDLLPGRYDVEIDYISYKKQLIRSVEVGTESTNEIQINLGLL